MTLLNEKIGQFRERATQYWNHFGKTQKIALLSILGIVLIVIVLLTYQFTKTEYEVAFQDLNAVDAAAIMSQLDANNISYKLGADGKSISVPSAQAAKVRVDIGSQGIIQNGSLGFGAFSESSTFGTTDREFDVKYNNALNGEIQQLLNRMQGVSDSKVVVTLPKESVFAGLEENEKALASVSLKFKPGYRPNQEAVDSYFNLVKTAVPKLALEDITITSEEGELISSVQGGMRGTLSSAIEEQMKLRKKFENDIRNSVKQFLGRWVSPDKIDVLVAASINFDKKNSEERLVEPVNTVDTKGIEISVQQIQKSFNGTNGQAGGIAGMGQQEVPGYPGADNSGTTNSEENSSTINYEVNRITNQIVSSPYTVKDLSINVAFEPPGGNPANLDESTKLAIETVLVNYVRASLADSGVTYTDEELAKKVSVVAQNFGGAAETTGTGGIATGWWIGGGVLALALLAGTAVLISRRRKRQEMEEEEIPLPAKVEFPSIDLENTTNESQVRKQLETLAKKKPDEFVNLLRTWLVEETR